MQNVRNQYLRNLIAIIFLAASQILPAAENQDQAGIRWRAVVPAAQGRTGFTSMSGADTGVTFTNRVDIEKTYDNHLQLHGSGVAAGDIDGDGHIDFYLCGIDRPNALYRNLGNWRFEEITEAAGVACPGQMSAGAMFADLDGDGDLDLLVSSYGQGFRYFRNDGKGKFTRDTTAGAPEKFGVTTLAGADIDGNGTLDIYATTFGTTSVAGEANTRYRVEVVKGKPVVAFVNGVSTTSAALTNRFWFDSQTGIIRENGEPDLLFLNDGRGKLTAMPWTEGAFQDENGASIKEPLREWGLATMFRDLNGDGAPDIYTCNDLFSPDRVWINDGRGHFRAIATLALRNTSYSSMGIDFADVNRDGLEDFFVVDMLSLNHRTRMTQTAWPKPIAQIVDSIHGRPQINRNTLFLNRGDGTYAEAAQMFGVDATEWSWTPIFMDVDLDGYEDLLVTNGHARDSLNGDANAEIQRRKAQKNLSPAEARRLSALLPELIVPNKLFRNVRGERFEDVSAQWGFSDTAIGNGMCAADLDNDGDLDIIVNNLKDRAALYRNDSSAPRVAFRLKGSAPNTTAVGAKIKLLSGAFPAQTQEIICGGRYLSSDDPMRVFAADPDEMTVEIRWRNGRSTRITGIKANRIYEIEESTSVETSGGKPAAPEPLFEDASSSIAFVHREGTFDDARRQALLPRKLSRLGPGAAWMDLNYDGLDDLVIGNGAGGELGIYFNEGGGKFGRLDAGSISGPSPDDQAGFVGWVGSFTFATANYETQGANHSVQRFQSTVSIKIAESLPAWADSAGPLVAADFDGDGALDLFVGARVAAGRYPQAVTSRFYTNQKGLWQMSQELTDEGLISGAVATDLDGDGKPELALACDWGPIRVLKWHAGKLTDATTGLGLGQQVGWWNSVTAGDFDGDGRMDLVAGNWGRNTKYQANGKRHTRALIGSFEGRSEIIEARFDPLRNALLPIRGLDFLARALPTLRDKYPNFAAFGNATITDILAGENFTELSVETFDSMIFLNRGDRFEAAPLPLEAQLSPVFGLSVADFDGDGAEDVVLSQNFFGVDDETSRYDAGRGLILRGNGQGRFASVPGQESGILVYGEGRGVAVSDYDQDGRTDVLITQNSHEAKLFRNIRGKAGLRIKLEGSPANPSAIGAVLRVVYPGRMGPAREIHAGSGYWSQDSSTQIFGSVENATGLWIRWPGGKTNNISLSSKGRTLVVSENGQTRTE